ncbi:MAG TPA: hypothetical protein DGG94_06930 [Micromonosporaceae bacterium]|nr:hypothetical protein [Micromonosporaceae bacterium]
MVDGDTRLVVSALSATVVQLDQGTLLVLSATRGAFGEIGGNVAGAQALSQFRHQKIEDFA